jgi:hypothetical protein
MQPVLCLRNEAWVGHEALEIFEVGFRLAV